MTRDHMIVTHCLAVKELSAWTTHGQERHENEQFHLQPGEQPDEQMNKIGKASQTPKTRPS